MDNVIGGTRIPCYWGDPELVAPLIVGIGCAFFRWPVPDRGRTRADVTHRKHDPEMRVACDEAFGFRANLRLCRIAHRQRPGFGPQAHARPRRPATVERLYPVRAARPPPDGVLQSSWLRDTSIWSCPTRISSCPCLRSASAAMAARTAACAASAVFVLLRQVDHAMTQ